MSKEKFLIDANVFITTYRDRYPFDIAPSFWEWLRLNIEAGNIILLDLVQAEVFKGDDELSNWIDDFSSECILDHRKDGMLIQHYGEVLKYIQGCEFYKDSALKEWAKDDIADGWLIAAAKCYDWSIITFETRAGVLGAGHPSKNAKIPDVGDHFSVKCVNLLYAMRELDFTFK